MADASAGRGAGLRLFFALFPKAEEWPADPALLAPARGTPPEKWHVTVLFLGDAPAESRAALDWALRETAGAHGRFTLDFEKFALRRPRKGKCMLWAQYHPHPVFRRIEGELRRAAARIGLHPARRRGAPVPHITLARAKHSDLVRMPETLRGHEAPPVAVDRISLVRSILSPDGSSYERLSAHDLK